MANGTGVQYIPGGGPGPVSEWQGIYYGYISVNVDPTDQGRVKLRVPQVFGNTTSGWASPMVPVTFIPKVGTAVTVMFVGGDPARPVWSGNFAVAGTPPVVINAGPPSDSNPGQLGEIWYDSANGMKTWEWNGASWIAYQIGTGGVAANIGLTAPSITGGTITGAQFIADGTSGEFLGYTGTPATGNMNFSISPVTGTDGHTNPYLDGFTVYHSGARIQVHVNSTVLAPAIEMTTGLTSEHGGSSLYTWSPNKGAANEFLVSFWGAPSSTFDSVNAAVEMQSAAKDGSGHAVGYLLMGGSVIAAWDAGGLRGSGGVLTLPDQIARKNSGFSGYPVLSQTSNPAGLANSTTTAVLATGSTPANDASVGTVYRLKGWGYGNFPASATFRFQLLAFGQAVATVDIAGTAFPSQTVNFDFEGSVYVFATGGGGSVGGKLNVSMQQSTTTATPANSVSAVWTPAGSLISVSTAAAGTVQLTGAWLSAPGGSFIQCVMATFERLGP